MNWQYFGIFGYLAVTLAAGAILLWAIHWKKPNPRTVRAAMLLAALAFAGARLNSSLHVNRIQLDPAEQVAAAKAREDQRRQAALASRGGEVADIRFAEDAEGEYYDRAGMDEADLKYLEGGDAPEPEWKKAKRKRGSDSANDDSLENRIGAKEDVEGVQTDAIDNISGRPAILMSAGDMAIANKIDRWNLRMTLALVIVGMVMLALDYLRRFNIYQEAGMPLPLPHGVRAAMKPMPALVSRPDPPRRDVPDELAWLLKRGEAFLYIPGDRTAADAAMARLEPLATKSRRADLIRVSKDTGNIGDEFVLDALWHGRASFVLDDPRRANDMLSNFVSILINRRSTRARTSSAFHLVWDRSEPVPELLLNQLTACLGQTGGSLFLLSAPSR